jgi:hypothetical protein
MDEIDTVGGVNFLKNRLRYSHRTRTILSQPNANAHIRNEVSAHNHSTDLNRAASSDEEAALRELETLLDQRIKATEVGVVSARTVEDIFQDVYREIQP